MTTCSMKASDEVNPTTSKLPKSSELTMRKARNRIVPDYAGSYLLHRMSVTTTRIGLQVKDKSTWMQSLRSLVYYCMVWYCIVWYGMDSLNVQCTFVDKCAAFGAPPAQCALASAPASVGPKRAACDCCQSRTTLSIKNLPARASAGSCRHRRCRRRA